MEWPVFMLVLVTLLHNVCSHPQVSINRGTGRRHLNTMHIIGGTRAEIREFPHMAAIGFLFDMRKVWLCGGTLISDRFVLTAAHCLEDYDYRRYGKAVAVRLADLDLRNTTDDANALTIRVIERFSHPNYTYPMKYNDVGLLKLKDAAPFNHFIKPACLHRTFEIRETRAQVVGWGFSGPGSPGQKLNKVTIDLVPFDRCTEVLNQHDALLVSRVLSENLKEDAMICAGVLAGGMDSCGGDSGGPLQVYSGLPDCSADIIGIVSFGLGGCALPNTPAVYVRVSHYVPWIESIMNSTN